MSNDKKAPVTINKDSLATLAAFEAAALRTAPAMPSPYDERARMQDLLHAVLGFVTEAAELADVLKKHLYYGKPVDWVNLQEELGDVMWYAPLACRALNTDMQSVAHVVISKLAKRYPDKFTSDAAINRDVEGERLLLEQLTENAPITEVPQEPEVEANPMLPILEELTLSVEKLAESPNTLISTIAPGTLELGSVVTTYTNSGITHVQVGEVGIFGPYFTVTDEELLELAVRILHPVHTAYVAELNYGSMWIPLRATTELEAYREARERFAGTLFTVIQQIPDELPALEVLRVKGAALKDVELNLRSSKVLCPICTLQEGTATQPLVVLTSDGDKYIKLPKSGYFGPYNGASSRQLVELAERIVSKK